MMQVMMLVMILWAMNSQGKLHNIFTQKCFFFFHSMQHSGSLIGNSEQFTIILFEENLTMIKENLFFFFLHCYTSTHFDGEHFHQNRPLKLPSKYYL